MSSQVHRTLRYSRSRGARLMHLKHHSKTQKQPLVPGFPSHLALLQCFEVGRPQRITRFTNRGRAPTNPNPAKHENESKRIQLRNKTPKNAHTRRARNCPTRPPAVTTSFPRSSPSTRGSTPSEEKGQAITTSRHKRNHKDAPGEATDPTGPPSPTQKRKSQPTPAPSSFTTQPYSADNTSRSLQARGCFI